MTALTSAARTNGLSTSTSAPPIPRTAIATNARRYGRPNAHTRPSSTRSFSSRRVLICVSLAAIRFLKDQLGDRIHGVACGCDENHRRHRGLLPDFELIAQVLTRADE